jgi:hypothetical protein
MTLAIILAAIGCLISSVTRYLRAQGRLASTTADALWALACLLTAVAFHLAGARYLEAVAAAASGWFAYAWWHGGGGAGSRRRFKSLARRFRPARRTAPSHV